MNPGLARGRGVCYHYTTGVYPLSTLTVVFRLSIPLSTNCSHFNPPLPNHTTALPIVTAPKTPQLISNTTLAIHSFKISQHTSICTSPHPTHHTESYRVTQHPSFYPTLYFPSVTGHHATTPYLTYHACTRIFAKEIQRTHLIHICYSHPPYCFRSAGGDHPPVQPALYPPLRSYSRTDCSGTYAQVASGVQSPPCVCNEQQSCE